MKKKVFIFLFSCTFRHGCVVNKRGGELSYKILINAFASPLFEPFFGDNVCFFHVLRLIAIRVLKSLICTPIAFFTTCS